jgi:2-phosphoglycerate kinase
LHASTYEAGEVLLAAAPTQCYGLTTKQIIIKGFKAQCALVLPELETIVAQWQGSAESAIVEGVHLTPKAVVAMMQQYPSIVPFLACPLSPAY